MKEEENLIEIDEDTIADVKWGIIKYSGIFIIFVFLPLLITILTGNPISKFNMFMGFIGLTLVCGEQVLNLGRFLLSIQMVYEEEESDKGE